MQKLKLDLDALAVQTFAVADENRAQGTVVAHSGFTNCGGLTCLLSLCDCAAE